MRRDNERSRARQFWEALRSSEQDAVVEDLVYGGRLDMLDWLDRFPDLPQRPSSAFYDELMYQSQYAGA